MTIQELGDIPVVDLILRVHIQMLLSRIQAVTELLVAYPEDSEEYKWLLVELNIATKTSTIIDEYRAKL